MADNFDPQQASASLWKRLTALEFPVHSLLVAHRGKQIWESHHTPYDRDTLHRMFSVTKSFCSLAVGSLAAEGRLSLDDPIIHYFPEYLPKDHPNHPWLADMTIRHMLMMQTCHDSTTYKLHPDRNWVESFFVTPPTHRSGQIFLYDTSSSHTLAALVRKLTGAGVLDYLRSRFLDEVGFSKTACILPDPFGSEMGGSGLMALPADLMSTALFIRKQLLHGTDAFSGYLRDAVRFQVPTLHAGQTLDEQQGYGYQFWQLRDGFAMYGMGGQYALFYPGQDLIVVTTADSQNIKGGNQKLLDAVREELLPAARPGSAFSKPADAHALASLTGSYRLLPSAGGFTGLSLEQAGDTGTLTLIHPDATHQISFGFDSPRISTLAKYQQPVATTARFLTPNDLFLYAQLCGESVGSLSFLIHVHEDGLTLWMKKVEESYFQEFTGFAEGVRC